MRQENRLFGIGIYVGAFLYLEKKSHDAAAILSSPEERGRTFVHAAKLNQIQDAFNDAYEACCKTRCEALKEPFKKKLGDLMQNLKWEIRLAAGCALSNEVDVWVQKDRMWAPIEDSKEISNGY